eukprot:2257176-Amphidinium_carterae.2
MEKIVKQIVDVTGLQFVEEMDRQDPQFVEEVVVQIITQDQESYSKVGQIVDVALPQSVEKIAGQR